MQQIIDDCVHIQQLELHKLVAVPVDNLHLVDVGSLDLVDLIVNIVDYLLAEIGIELHTAGFGDGQLEFVVDQLGFGDKLEVDSPVAGIYLEVNEQNRDFK